MLVAMLVDMLVALIKAVLIDIIVDVMVDIIVEVMVELLLATLVKVMLGRGQIPPLAAWRFSFGSPLRRFGGGGGSPHSRRLTPFQRTWGPPGI
jgi:hypothetical protein